MLLGAISGLAAVAAAMICAGTGSFAGLRWLWAWPACFALCWVVLTAVAFVFLLIMAMWVDQDVPQEKNSRFYRAMTLLYIGFIKSVVRLRVDTRGLDKTPQEGRFMLVCNHLNDSDPAILLYYFKKSRIAFISKQENKDMFIVGKLMHKLQCQLLNRDNDRDALRCILKCIQMLKDDRASIAVFPEGYVSKQRRLLPFRSGVVKIAQKAQVPIVVCTLQGTEHVFRNIMRLKPTNVRLHLLEVIPAEELNGKSTVEIARRVRAVMAEDLDPEYRPAE